MRKLIVAALMVLGTSTAFAADSPALKAILGAKTYAEAEALLKQSLEQLAGPEEKAEAYNHLVDLSMDDFNKESQVALQNATMKQMGQEGNTPFDTLKMYQSYYNAMQAALECNNYDQMPNEKGKVKPKYEKSNANRLYSNRVNLIQGGEYFRTAGKNEVALDFYKAYVVSYDAPLFNSVKKKPDEFYYDVARVGAVVAFQLKNYDVANEMADVAMKGSGETAEQGLNVKLAVMGANLKNHEDSVAYTNKVKELYAKNTKNEMIFGTLVTLYSNMKMKDELNKLFDEKLAEDPNNFVVYAVRGQNAQFEGDIDTAIPNYKKAIEIQPDNAQILTYLGACLFDKAQKAEEKAGATTGEIPATAKAQIEPVFKEAEGYLEKAKQLDPNREQSQWAYPLYRVYYRLYGPQDPKTVEAEALTK